MAHKIMLPENKLQTSNACWGSIGEAKPSLEVDPKCFD